MPHHHARNLTLELLHARAQVPVDAETNLNSPVKFADVASKETTSFDI